MAASIFALDTASSNTASTSWAIGWTTDATSATCKYIRFNPASGYIVKAQDLGLNDSVPSKIPAGARSIELPDGAKLIIDAAGNYRIEDKDAKVTYKANRVREFSPHLNASDLLAQFVRYVGTLGVTQADVLRLPIELFINWLVIEAAERDQDPVPADVVPVESHLEIRRLRKPQCLHCGRFIPRLFTKHRFAFCGPEHGIAYLRRAEPEQLQLAGVAEGSGV